MSQSAQQLFDLNGRVALVTGASRGIGEAIARGLAANGATVVISSRKLEGCKAVADAIVEAGGKAEARTCHIGEPEQIESLCNEINEAHGSLDMLVNNAAANPYFGHILDTDPGAFQKTVDVNIRGYFMMSQAAGRTMRENGGGSILNVASVNGVVPGPMQGIYSITKAAIISMTRAFARECAPDGIRCNALLPGITETHFAGALVKDENILKQVLPHVPMGRIAQPEEMVGAAIYLLSDAASYTTGATLEVDGGYLTV